MLPIAELKETVPLPAVNVRAAWPSIVPLVPKVILAPPPLLVFITTVESFPKTIGPPVIAIKPDAVVMPPLILTVPPEAAV